MKRSLSSVFVSFLFVTLVACGFQLRGAVEVPENLKSIYVQGINLKQDLGRDLKRGLTDNGIEVLDDYQEGKAVLTVLENKADRRVLSVGSDGKVSEFLLYGAVRFKIADGDGQVLIANEEVEAWRNFQFNQEAVLGMSEEENALRQQLNQQLVQSILRRLSVLK